MDFLKAFSKRGMPASGVQPASAAPGSWRDGPTLSQIVMRSLARFPDRIAFRSGSQSISYAAARDLIGRMQGVLARAGVRRGDRVAGLSGNRFESWCAGVAVHGLGAVTTPLHPLGSLQDHTDHIADAEASFLLADASRFAERAGELAHAPSLRGCFTLGRMDVGLDLLGEAADNVCSPVDLSSPDDLASLNYTGGTTGRAKGVMRSHRELTAGLTSVLASFEMPHRPVFLAAAPISHMAGLFVAPVLVRGGTVDLLPAFSPDGVVRRIGETGASFTLLVPSMIYAILDQPGWDRQSVKSLELLIYGASPMSPGRLAEGLDRLGPVFCQLYGQTECFVISSLGAADHDVHNPGLLASAGYPVVDCDVRLLKENGAEAGVGERGEICVRAPYAMCGYWKQTQASAEVIRDGWIHTGDIAWRDEQGRLFIVDRKKDMIVTGGFNVYPRDVELALLSAAGVAGAAVIGVPDARWGEAVKAFIILAPGASPEPRRLEDWVRDKKGAAHVPKSFEFVDRLPVTPLGKVDKSALRARFWSGQARGVS